MEKEKIYLKSEFMSKKLSYIYSDLIETFLVKVLV